MLTVLGEAIVDLVAEGERRFVAHPGGSPLNVAVGLGRLGQPVSLAARLSRDTFGSSVPRSTSPRSGVDPRHLVEAAEPSTLAVATLDADGVAAYDFWTEGTADWQWTEAELAGVVDDDTVVLHTGSLALELEPGAGRIVDLLARIRRRRTTISYDPNVRMARRGPVEAGRAAVERVVGAGRPGQGQRRGPGLALPGRGAGGGRDPVGGGRPGAGRGDARPGRRGGAVRTGGARAPGRAAGRRGRHRRRRRRVQLRAARRAGRAGRAWPGRKAGLAGVDLPAVLDRATLVAALTCARPGADPPTLAEVAEAENPRPERLS